MHEFSIAVRLVEAVEQALAERGIAAEPTRVLVRVGELSGVVPEALELAFPAAAHGSQLALAALEIETVPLVLRCEGCGREWHADEPFLLCEECGGGAAVTVLSGRELDLIAIEVEGEE
jgi:hydrogenase nickel incorporation protein HypA/HybF